MTNEVPAPRNPRNWASILAICIGCIVVFSGLCLIAPFEDMARKALSGNEDAVRVFRLGLLFGASITAISAWVVAMISIQLKRRPIGRGNGDRS